MLKTLWRVVWRTGLLFLILILAWQIAFRLPISFAENSTRQGIGILDSVREFPELQAWLINSLGNNLKSRDRGLISTVHDQGLRARDEAKKRLDVVNSPLGLMSFPTNEPAFYKKVNDTLLSTNELLVKNKDYYQHLYDFFSYYEQSTAAIFNLMYYDPALVIGFYEKSPDPDILIQSFGRDFDGLKQTQERIVKLPGYQGDNIKSLAPLLDPLINKAKLISDTAGHDQKQALSIAKELDHEVSIVQQKFLSSRRNFWTGLNPEQFLVEFTTLRVRNINKRVELGTILVELGHRH